MLASVHEDGMKKFKRTKKRAKELEEAVFILLDEVRVNKEKIEKETL